MAIGMLLAEMKLSGIDLDYVPPTIEQVRVRCLSFFMSLGSWDIDLKLRYEKGRFILLKDFEAYFALKDLGEDWVNVVIQFNDEILDLDQILIRHEIRIRDFAELAKKEIEVNKEPFWNVVCFFCEVPESGRIRADFIYNEFCERFSQTYSDIIWEIPKIIWSDEGCMMACCFPNIYGDRSFSLFLNEFYNQLNIRVEKIRFVNGFEWEGPELRPGNW